MLTKIVRLEKLGGFRLRLRFSDGTEGVRNFSALVQQTGSMLVPLRDEAYFNRVFLEYGALTWPNGFDLDSIALHDRMAAAGELSQVAAE
jgi:hypothetical protein